MAIEASRGDPLGRLLTPEEVGAILGRHPKTVRRLVNIGELPGIVLGGRTLRFTAEDVQDYVDRHRTDQTKP